MAITGVKPSELDAATVAALQTKLEIPESTVTADDASTMLYGQGLMNIRRKIKTMLDLGKPADSIRIVVFSDSIIGSSSLKQSIVDYFNDNYAIPDANIDVNCSWGAYASNMYLPCLDGAVIQPNVDLFIFSENEDSLLDQIIAKVKSMTNADIMLGTWSMKADTGYPRYNRLVDIAKKHGCELWDINGILLRKYIDGTQATYQTDGLHLSAAGCTYVLADFVKHFEGTRYHNEYVNFDSPKENVIWLGAEKMIPVNGITFSGTWAVQGTFAAITKADMVRSSTATDYIEFTFTGIGFELLFAANVAENVHNVLVDGAAPSAYVISGRYLEYCTQIIGKTQTEATWYFHRLFAAQVTAPFMTNDEDEVEFEITIGAPVRVGGVLTELPYTLRQGVDVLGTGDIFTTAAFVFRTTGEITIPATVYETANFYEAGTPYLFTEGDTMQFFARKTWKDSIDTNTETFLRVAGLARASHTVRITKANNVASDLKYLSLYK